MVENKITKNKYFYATIVGIGMVLVAVFVIFVIIIPFFNNAKELTSKTKTKHEELKKLEEKLVKLEELKNREEELQKDAEVVRNALPEGKDVGRLFIEFDNLAKQSGGNIETVEENTTETQPLTTQNVGTPSTGIQKINYKVTIYFKDYFGLKNFVTKAETALRIIDIGDYSIEVGKDKLSVTLTANTYVRSNP